MSEPRQVLPGSCYLVTRRCAQGEYLLRPSPIINRIFGYVLGLAAGKYGVVVHAFCVMSNHHHLVVSDPKAQLPLFLQYVGAMVARAVNAHLGRSEALWGGDTYSAVELIEEGDVVDKVAYTLANPVEAGLVRHGREWPGLWSEPKRMGGKPYVFEKPKGFFRRDPAKVTLPEKVELELAVPAGFESAAAFRSAVEEALAVKEALAVEKHGGRFLGAARVLQERTTRRSELPDDTGDLNPRIAAKDPVKRAEAIERLKRFVAEYRDAWRRWREGARKVVFPLGTYQVRVTYGLACASG